MKDLKSTFISILKALYRPIAIPFFLLILFLLANQYFVIDSLFKEKIILGCEAYQREMEDYLLDVENKEQSTWENLFADEYIQQSSHAFLKSFDGQLVAYTLYNKEETLLLAGSALNEKQILLLQESLQEDQVIFKYGFFRKTVYYSWGNQQLGYGIVFSVFEIYSIIIVVIFFFTIFLIHFNYFRSKKIIMKLTEKLAKPIIVLENKMKAFNVKTSEADLGQCESKISEVVSIHNSFIKMSDNILASYEEMASMNEELEASYSENEELIEKIEGLLDTPQTFYSTHDSEEMLCQLFKAMIPMLHRTDFGLVSVIRDDRLQFIESVGIDLDTINSMKIPASKHLDMEKILFKTYDEGDFHERLAPAEQTEDMKQMTLSITQALIIPILSKNKFYGHIAFYNLKNSPNKLTEEDFRIAEFYSHYLKAFLLIRELSELEQHIQKETIFSIIRLLEQHDPYTKGHSENVAKLASEFAAFMKLPEKKVQDIYWAGLIHDMGKILIPHTILNKPAKLTVEEFEEIKKHPLFAYDVFKDSLNLKDIAFYVKYHHERYDGRGYPEGLRGEAIPFESRILCIADSWDAMRAKRVYKKGSSKDESLKEMQKNKGIQFDPQLVDRWLEFLKYHSDE